MAKSVTFRYWHMEISKLTELAFCKTWQDRHLHSIAPAQHLLPTCIRAVDNFHSS